nr:hypothetical protein [Pyrinomonadaceae bacterium]
MKAKIIIIVCLSLFFISAISNHLFQNVKSQNAVNKKLITVCPSPTPTPNNFPSYHEDFPFDETFCAKGEKPFELSQDYPLSFTSEKLRWTKIVKKKSDFKTKWREYLMAVLNYGYEGNLEENFEVQKNRVRNWYHAPWMHYGATGREFVHGLTRERRACLEVLLGAKKCFDEKNRTIQNWAVSFYNAPGGFYIGKVWREMYNPELDIKRPNKHPDAANFPKEGFPEGTVVIKLIFTDAINQPIVKGSVTWNAHINELKENNEIN